MTFFHRATLALASCLLLISFSGHAQCPPAAELPTPEHMPALLQSAKDRGFLWKISKQGQDSWLYGTIHANRLEGMLPGPQTRQALQQSDVIALELNLADPATITQIMALSKRGAGRVPAQFLPRLKAQLNKNCLPLELIGQQHPSLLFSSIMLTDARHDGIEPAFGSEIMLLGLAQGSNKPVIALETPKEQMGAMLGEGDKILPEQFEAGLALLESGQGRAQVVKMVDVWNRSDLAVFENYRQWCQCVETAADRAMMKRINDDRNVVIAQRIAQQYRQGQTMFIAVGSLHMVGKTGLPSLLKQHGFTVERVVFDDGAGQ
ncbi:TraB/GumN family protein [Chitinibacter sp. FCG-7]|uniref:TraB/GumN family protein n=1 Tax=Chitinibacter mangrovi TaxID=3153927 RepID=A0AAU7F6P0_9NEIS